MGLYYAAPLLGPSLGPLVGGVVTKLFSWRATFYFLAIFGGVSLITFILFKDTFRRERSLAYQAALRKARLEMRLTAAMPKVDGTLALDNDARHGEMNAITSSVSDSVSKSARETLPKDLESQPQRTSVDTVCREPKVGLRHMQTFQPMLLVLGRPNNLCVLGASGMSQY